MTTAAASNTDVVFSEGSSDAQGPNVYALPEEYESIRADERTQFAPLDLKVPEPREPSWFEEWLQSILVWLAELFAPLGSALSSSWGMVQWALVAALAAFVIYLVFRLIGPAMQRIQSATETGTEEPEWQPDEQESLALLEDADRLAAQGHYDEAARLLLQRSVGQIAAARPDWVDPSSTARELAELFAPLGSALSSSWGVVQWALVAALVAFVIYLVFRLIGPAMQRIQSATETGTEEPEWQPDEQESLALLEDADRLAAQGHYDEAARLLLQRSVGQIAAARPDWVDPSSTARELAALPRLSDAARSAFSIVSEAVEQSLFALHHLTREDWEHARAAYADFALARIDSGKKNAVSPSGLQA